MNKKVNFIFIILFIGFLTPRLVLADNCSQEIVNNFNALVNNIKFEFIHEDNNSFNLNIYNIPKEIMVVYTRASRTFSNNESNISTATGYLAGQTYKFMFVPTSEITCDLGITFTKNLYVAKYNEYSEREICKNDEYKNFKYCNENYQGTITDEDFEKELKKYEEQLMAVEEIPDIKEQDNFFKENLSFITIGIVILIILPIIVSVIIRIKKKGKKF